MATEQALGKTPNDLLNSISLPVRAGGAKRKFNSVQQLDNFIQQEVKAWEWLKESSPQDEKHIKNNIYSIFVQKIIERLTQIKAEWIAKNENECNNLVQQFEEIMVSIRFPFSKTELGKYILNFREQSEITSAFMVHLWCFPKLSSNSVITPILTTIVTQYKTFVSGNNQRSNQYYIAFEPQRLEANRLLMGFEFRSSKSAISNLSDYFFDKKTNINKLVADSQNKADEFNNWLKEKEFEFTVSMEEKIEELFERYKTVRKREAKLNSQIKADSKKAYGDAINITTTAKDTYQSQIELDSSVTYWDTKKTTHKNSRDSWFKGLLACITATIALPIILFWANFSFGLPVGKLLFGTINPLTITFSILIISMGSFCIRFCSRQYDSQQHLFLEAIERQTMLKTFLALMNENKLKEFEDRKIALDTLFRPAQTGIVADYGNIVPSDSIIKIIEKQSSVVK